MFKWSNQESSIAYNRSDDFYRGNVVTVTVIVHNITAVFAQWEADEPSDAEVGPAPDLAPSVEVRPPKMSAIYWYYIIINKMNLNNLRFLKWDSNNTLKNFQRHNKIRFTLS